MKRPVLLLYGIVSYAAFNISFLYLAGFLLDVGVPKSINEGNVASLGIAAVTNFGLIFLFGFFHSLMARQWFKNWWTRFVPVEAERSTYVLQAAAFLSLLMGFWKPMPAEIWSVTGWSAVAVYLVFAIGLTILLLSTFLIDHFELFGLRQVWSAGRGSSMPSPRFRTPLLYKLVRHPMQLGVMLAFFATPHMTVGHLFFAVAMTGYVLIGLYFEERALVREFGDNYRDYQARVPMLLPNPLRLFSRAPSKHAA
ncbi:methanethiol S-methyltransferase [Roseibium album]|uniref:methanethiol S-methyltransferase n=1 Tax=Roseibium album TaxID=311410 RepID=UPI000CF0B804|nr:methanethiol S-methyltransferase [Roseibium album]MBG6145261.1 protein-S-isoprenylcysteine O-methyltransferase Ste14 [Labrenzia sp. EL_142]